MIRCKREGVRWEMVESWAPRLERLLATPGQSIKDTRIRRITRHSLDGRFYYVKRYLHANRWWAPVKYAWRTPESRREWRVAPELVARQVAVVPHCAHGERWSWRGLHESILITEERPGTDLRTIPGLDVPRAQRALGEFVRRMHEAGVFHRDLHVGNLLFDEASNTFCLVDVANVIIKPSLTAQEKISDLAKLNARLPLSLAFYEGYGCAGPEWEKKVTAATETRFRDGLSRYVRISLRPGLSFAPRRFGSLTWQVRVRALNEAMEAILSDPDGFLERDARLLKKGFSSTVGCRAGLVLKRSNPRKWRNLMVDLFRRSRSRRAFLLARRLELVKIASPRPLATADRRRFGLPWCSYLLMDEISGATPAYLWRGSKREAVERTAALLARLHEEGFVHRDLKDSNIVFDKMGQPYLLDLDGLRHLKRVPDRRAARNLARLAQALRANEVRLRNTPEAFVLGRSDRIRFVRHYCQERGRTDWRWWWRAIDELMQTPRGRPAGSG